MRLDHLPPFPGHELLRVVVETPRGSRHQYSYDPFAGMIALHKSLPEGMAFPREFGFIPQTQGANGAPLEVLVLTDAPAPPGCVIDSRLIGVVQVSQVEHGHSVRNDRFVAVAKNSVEFQQVHDWEDLPPKLLQQIKEFFENYHKVRGTRFTALHLAGPKVAWRLIHAQRVPPA